MSRTIGPYARGVATRSAVSRTSPIRSSVPSFPWNSQLTGDQVNAADFIFGWAKAYLTSNALKDQENQDPLGTYHATTLANIYLQALAAIVALQVDDITVARAILDNLQTLYTAHFVAGPGGLYGAFDSGTLTAYTDGDRYVGNNAFVLLALCHYQKAANDNRYKTMADGIATWIVSLQDIASKQNHYSDGGFYTGYRGHTSGTPDAFIAYKVTEANIDAIAALRSHASYYGGAYGTNATQAETFLLADGTGSSGGLYYTAQSRFCAGKTDSATYPIGSPTYDTTHYLDNVLWAAMVATSGANLTKVLTGLTAVDSDLLLSSVHPNISLTLSLNGYTDQAGTAHIFTEGYAYYAIMQYRRYQIEFAASGNTPTAQSYLQSRSDNLDKYIPLLIRSLVVAGTVGPIQKTNLPGYTGETTSIGAEAAMWYCLAAAGVNPFNA